MRNAEPAMQRVGAIDCGTNTVRLLIADISTESPRVHDVVRRMETVRLGEGVDATGRLSEAALQRAGRTFADYANVLREHDVQHLRMVATSATRDAANKDVFYALVREHLALTPEVISGHEEASLTASGVMSGLGIDAPSLILDIGGGSTEFVRVEGASTPAAISTDVGVVRLSERHLHNDPPLEDEAAAVRADTREAVSDARGVIGDIAGLRMVGVAGTVTTAVGIALGLSAYDSSAIHGATVSRAQLDAVADWALSTDTDVRAAHPVMHPGRAPVFAAGMLILQTIMRECGAESLTASESDILDGIVLSVADR